MSRTDPYTTLRAVMLEKYGKPPSQQVKLTTIPVPSLTSPTQVLIRVLSCALNPIDGMIIQGDAQSFIPLNLPSPIGFDVSGIVVKVGTSVRKFKVGDAVFSRVDHDKLGTFAEYCVTSEDSVAMKPQSINHDEAASLPLVALTALQGLRDVGGLMAGQKVLITGGTGGVGTAAIQIAKILGASEIITTASSDFNRLLQLGATRAIDYKNEKFNETVKGMDLVFDTVGQPNSCFSCLKSGCTCVSIVGGFKPSSLKNAGVEVSMTTQAYLTAQVAPIEANALLHGVKYDSVYMKPDGAELKEIAQWVDQGKMKPVLDKIFKFDETPAALDYLVDGHARGKIVVHVADV